MHLFSLRTSWKFFIKEIIYCFGIDIGKSVLEELVSLFQVIMK